MKKISIKEHTKKYMAFAKKAGSGGFPNKKAAKTGSLVGLGVGVIFIIFGLWGLLQNIAWGIESMFVGILAGVSNIVTLIKISLSHWKDGGKEGA